jgi:nucleoid-associated protein YgaU
MSKKVLLYITSLGFLFLISGCVVRTYPLTRDRVDQDLAGGNRGYLQGKASAAPEVTERKTTRTTRVVEIELHPPVKFERMPKPKTAGTETPDNEIWGNRGYITKKNMPEADETMNTGASAAVMEKYTVDKNDTLQKISAKFYGTSKKWNRIYEANKDTLKGPNKIYPGQVLNIPADSSVSAKSGNKGGNKTETLKEPEENLK